MTTNEAELPLIFVHRSPIFTFVFKDQLTSHFRLIDSPESQCSFDSIRALLCVGLTPVTSDTLSLFPSLELVVGTSAGIDHIDLAECRRRQVAVTNNARAFTEDAADYAVALLMGVLRRISAADRYVRAGRWPRNGDYPLGFKLGGKKIGILGLGNIGSEIATRLEAFGCRIAYHSRKKKPSVSYVYYTNVQDLAVNSDVLVVCCSLTKETHHIINKHVIAALGKEGIIINVGRGALIDEKELLNFLTQGEIGGAGLDVFEDEPDVPKEFFELDNVVLSPHCAVMTPESFAAAGELVKENLIAFFTDKSLISPVQFE